MVVPIAPRLTAICHACTEPGIVDWLKSKNHEIIDVRLEESMALGCNFMSSDKKCSMDEKSILPSSPSKPVDQSASKHPHREAWRPRLDAERELNAFIGNTPEADSIVESPKLRDAAEDTAPLQGSKDISDKDSLV